MTEQCIPATAEGMPKKGKRNQHQQVMDMENPINDLESATSIINRLLQDKFTHLQTDVTGSANLWHVSQREISDLFFAASRITDYGSEIKARWEAALEAAR